MDILDKNGRLFGKINIIDLTIILVFLFAIPVFTFSYRAMTLKRDPAKAAVAERWTTVRLRLQSYDPEVIKVIKEGDVEKNDMGKEIGVLVKKDISDYDITSKKELKIISIEEPKIWLKKELVIKILCTEHNGILYYKSCCVKIGSPLTFSAIMYDVTGVVIKIE